MSAPDAIAHPPESDHETDSKSAQLAAQYVKAEPGSRWIRRHREVRELLRSPHLRQASVEVAPVEQEDPTRASIFFLHGEDHRRRRTAIAPFFTPNAVNNRHMRVMQGNSELLVAEFERKGRARLDDLSLRLAAAVVFEIVGLSSRSLARTARRIEMHSGAELAARGGIYKLLATLRTVFYALQVLYLDVKPAIAERRVARQEDVISRLLDEGRSDKEILVECLTFGMAGMTTTREFIVMAAWHLLENEALRRRFLEGDTAQQNDILSEILRLEPVASMIWRSATEEIRGITDEPIPVGTRLALDLRAANLDEEEVGPAPLALDPDRARRLGANGTYLSFGNGAHFCPGSQLAIVETRVFLERLLRVPGIRLEREPDMQFCPPMLMSYQLRNALISCTQ